MAGLLSLPIETIDVVCALVRASDLVALALTSRTLAHVAQRQLYRHVVLPSTAKSAVLTLARNARLAQHVRSFELAPGDEQPGDVFPAFVRMLARAVANMRAAVSLTFAVSHHAAIFTSELHRCFGRTADDLEFTQLRSLACDLTFDTYTAGFLARCPALVSLHLGVANASAPPLALPPSVAPRLETLVGAADAARLLVPGRPVYCVQLLSPDALDVQTVAALASSAVPIGSLDAVMADFSLSQLAHVAGELGSHLENLRIAVLNAFESAPDATFLSPVADVLDTFADLWSFELSGIHWASSVKPDAGGNQKRAWQREPLQLNVDTVTPTAEVHGDSLEHDDGWGFDVLL